MTNQTPSNSVVTEAMIEAARQASDWVADLRDDEITHIYLAMQSANTTGSDELVERRTMGEVGSLQRELFVAGCAMRDIAALDEHADLPDWVKAAGRDGAEAIRRLIAIATPDTDRVAVLERALAIAIASLGRVSVRCFDTPKSPLKPLGDIAREGLALVATTLGDDAYDRLAALSQPLGSQENGQ